MSEVDLENFEKRATAAESQIETLTKRMEELEKALGHQPATATSSAAAAGDGDKAALSAILEQVKQVYALVLAEEKQAQEVIKERDRLKVQNAKLEYRVKLLVRSLEEEEAKNQPKKSA